MTWTCPFCPLACDHAGVRIGSGAQPLELQGADCALARAKLAGFTSAPAEIVAEVDGQAAALEAAVAAAAQRLAASRQPLFAGLGTDVAGMRALYPLACATGAICDAAPGEALMHGLRALQQVRVIRQLGATVPAEPLAEHLAHAARLGVVEVGVAVQPPVEQLGALVVAKTYRTAAGHQGGGQQQRHDNAQSRHHVPHERQRHGSGHRDHGRGQGNPHEIGPAQGAAPPGRAQSTSACRRHRRDAEG